MKKLKNTAKVFNFLKITSLLIAAGFNFVGLYLLFVSHPYWNVILGNSIFILGSTLVFSFIGGSLESRLSKKSLELFLENEGLKDATILRDGESFVILEHNGEQVTVYVDKTKNGYGYIIAPSKVELEGKFVNLNGVIEDKKVSYEPYRVGYEWHNNNEDSKEDIEENKKATAKDGN